ncbi:hypothetical protein [Rhodopirellula halodulae]|uniref:hypothetical protein n=1 Tax=Rhodopirellula halodulae TaxID=2894198 RepID=UPI001E5142E5|nr:hypothetical protein [Rhodopirellula sp. JC737]MCC9655287.1 hypothetical protein [Rhodopirellula sp. JC737]
MSFHPGRLAKLYYNSGTYASPTWVEIVRVSDVNVNMTKNTGSVTTRESPDQKTVIGSKIFQLTATYHEKIAADSVLDAILTSYMADTPDDTGGKMDMAAMNQDIETSGSTGVRGQFAVTELSRAEPVNDSVTRSVTWEEVDHEESDSVVDVVEFTTS